MPYAVIFVGHERYEVCLFSNRQAAEAFVEKLKALAPVAHRQFHIVPVSFPEEMEQAIRTLLTEG